MKKSLTVALFWWFVWVGLDVGVDVGLAVGTDAGCNRITVLLER
jgi:hypothetical protein